MCLPEFRSVRHAHEEKLVALQTCEFLVVTGANFQAILQHHPEVFRDAMDHLCREARQAYLWIATLA